MPKKSSLTSLEKLSIRYAELEKTLEQKEKLIASLRRENFKLQDALPEPNRGVYIYLEFDGSLQVSLQTETSTKYSIRIDESLAGLNALMRILRSRVKFLSKAFASDSCPSQSEVNDWMKKNKVTCDRKFNVKEFEP